MDPDPSSDVTGSQEILVAFWAVLMGVLTVIFVGVMYTHYKNNKLLHGKLYNFKLAPKKYIDDDSFINFRDL